tara:strand:+ start:306 stop:485 length:180 start_codon:yes stop_codon:yes gene_type:complete
MRKDDERAELVAARDAAERNKDSADTLYHGVWVARRDAVRVFNEASLAVYHYDAAQGED